MTSLEKECDKKKGKKRCERGKSEGRIEREGKGRKVQNLKGRTRMKERGERNGRRGKRERKVAMPCLQIGKNCKL